MDHTYQGLQNQLMMMIIMNLWMSSKEAISCHKVGTTLTWRWGAGA